MEVYSMFEFNYSQLIRFDIRYCRTNRHGTHVFDLIVKPDGFKGVAFAKIHLNKHQEIQIDFESPEMHWDDFMKNRSLGIFKEKITEVLLAQITAEQLIQLIK